MSHIVDFCPLTKLNGGLSQLHSADDEAVAWMIAIALSALTRRRKSHSCLGLSSADCVCIVLSVARLVCLSGVSINCHLV